MLFKLRVCLPKDRSNSATCGSSRVPTLVSCLVTEYYLQIFQVRRDRTDADGKGTAPGSVRQLGRPQSSAVPTGLAGLHGGVSKLGRGLEVAMFSLLLMKHRENPDRGVWPPLPAVTFLGIM